MLAANHIGRVGGLAAALGVGVALFTMPTQALADSAKPEQSQTEGSATTEGSAKTQGSATSRRSSAAHRSGVAPRDHVSQSSVKLPSPLASSRREPTADRRVSVPAAIPAKLTSSKGAVTPAADVAANDGPLSPAVSPLDSIMVAAARREVIGEPSVQTQLTDGIINGSISAVGAPGIPVVYTVTRSPNLGGKVSLDGDTGRFSYLPTFSALTSGATEKFTVVAFEEKPLVAALDQLLNSIDFAARDSFRSFLADLHQIPVVNILLRPIIGTSQTVTVSVDNGQLVPEPFTTPVAYTVKVISFDGTLISTNFFPAVGLQAGQNAPSIFTTGGLSSPGMTDPYGEWDRSVAERPGLAGYLVPGIAPLRETGYNVITWDSRGKGDSGGQLEFGNPEFEGRDTQNVITYFTKTGWITPDDNGDFQIGMVGGSFGAVQELVTAAIDHRIDAIVPGIAPNTLITGIYPDDAFNTVWGGLLLPTALLGAGARVNPELYLGSVTGILFDWITPGLRELLNKTGPGVRVEDITAATLLISGIPDTLFPLNQSLINAAMLESVDTPAKVIWYCGGHGVCLNPASPIQNDLIMDATLNWLDQYVKGQEAQRIPTFQWVDQLGQFYASDYMPFDSRFTGDPLVTSSHGGVLPILSVLGGGGPNLAALPDPALATARALNAVNLKVTAPQTGSNTQVVGVPELTFTYRGLGLTSHVFAQFVDDQTGVVLGNAVTPIPVVLDGRERTVTVALDGIAQTMAPGTSITLQITNSALPFFNYLALGVLGISAMQVSLPTVADSVAVSVGSP